MKLHLPESLNAQFLCNFFIFLKVRFWNKFLAITEIIWFGWTRELLDFSWNFRWAKSLSCNWCNLSYTFSKVKTKILQILLWGAFKYNTLYTFHLYPTMNKFIASLFSWWRKFPLATIPNQYFSAIYTICLKREIVFREYPWVIEKYKE